MMDYIRNYKLSHAMLTAPTIYYEIVEEVWSSAFFYTKNKVLSFTVKNIPYFANNDVMIACFQLPENTHGEPIVPKKEIMELEYI